MNSHKGKDEHRDGSWHLEKYLGIAAFVISLTALLFSIYQTRLSHEHNKLSVRPKLDWRLDHSDNAGDPWQFRIRLINAGLGPAKVENVRFVVEDQILGLAGRDVCIALDGILKADVTSYQNNSCFSIPDEEWLYMNPSEEIVLYQIGRRESGITDWIWPAEGPRIRVLVDYCSFYDDCETLE